MGPHRRTSPKVRGSLAGIERRAREIVEKHKYETKIEAMLSDVLKEIKEIRKLLNSK